MANPRILWLAIYLAANVAALLWCLATGELMGDGAGFAVNDVELLWKAFGLLVIAMLGLYGLFNLLCRIDFGLPSRKPDSRLFGTALAALLVSFICYVQVTGLFIAGSAERGGTLASALFVLFNVDLLFLIFYATSRGDTGFRWVALLWLVSIVQRGWFAYLFILAAMEMLRLVRHGRLRLRWVVAMALVALAFPFLDALKIFIRINPGVDLMEMISEVPAILANVDLSAREGLAFLYERVVGRIQVLSHAYLIMEHGPYFRMAIENELVGGFWNEGYFGLLFDRLFGHERPPGSAQVLAEFIAPNLDSAWNVNPSIVGWFFVYAASFPLTLLYVGLLCVASFVLLGRFASDLHARDALWSYWVVFLVPGWVSQFASLLGALLLLTAIDVFVRLFDFRTEDDSHVEAATGGRLAHGDP